MQRIVITENDAFNNENQINELSKTIQWSHDLIFNICVVCCCINVFITEMQ